MKPKKSKILKDKPTTVWKTKAKSMRLYLQRKKDENIHRGMLLQVVVTRKTSRGMIYWIVFFGSAWPSEMKLCKYWHGDSDLQQHLRLPLWPPAPQAWRFSCPVVLPRLWVISLLGVAPPASLLFSATEEVREHHQPHNFWCAVLIWEYLCRVRVKISSTCKWLR